MQSPLLTAAIALVIALAGALALVIYRRRTGTVEARLKDCCVSVLQNVLIPDGEEGEIHIEYALLCTRGVVVLNLKEIAGNVFGSDSMQEWTVITGKSRYTFMNPQQGLYDRLAAVRRLLPDIPVHGYVGFPDSAKFTKGRPSHVVMVDELITELQAESTPGNAIDAYWPAWETLKTGSRLNAE